MEESGDRRGTFRDPVYLISLNVADLLTTFCTCVTVHTATPSSSTWALAMRSSGAIQAWDSAHVPATPTQHSSSLLGSKPGQCTFQSPCRLQLHVEVPRAAGDAVTAPRPARSPGAELRLTSARHTEHSWPLWYLFRPPCFLLGCTAFIRRAATVHTAVGNAGPSLRLAQGSQAQHCPGPETSLRETICTRTMLCSSRNRTSPEADLWDLPTKYGFSPTSPGGTFRGRVGNFPATLSTYRDEGRL